MLTGRVAFAGDTVSDSIAKILEREPDWSALPVATPASIRRLLFRALTKDPKKRLRDISDVRIEIDSIDEALPGDAERAQPSTRVAHRQTWLPWSAALVLGMGVAAAVVWNLRPLPALSITGFTHSLPPDQVLNASRGAQIVALSPDGAQLVYSGTPSGLYVRLMSDVNAKVIPGTESFEATGPVFSPDGRSIAFFTIADQTLKKIAVTGGAPQTLCPVDGPPLGMTWGPEGIVFGHGRQGIKRVSADGGTPEVLVQVNDGEAAHGPQILPGGEHVLFTLAKGTAPLRWDKAHIVVESLKDHQRQLLIDGGSDARYLATGHLVYAIMGSIHAVAFDPLTLELGDERAPVIEGVRRAAGSSTGAAAFSVSRTGALGYVPGPAIGEVSALDLALMDRSGEVQPLQLPPGPYALPRVSPRGTRVAFQSDDGNEAIIYTHELSGMSTVQRLTTEGNNRFPLWASESRVVFQSDRQGDRAVWWQSLDGPAERLTTPEKGTSHTPESWFDDSASLQRHAGVRRVVVDAVTPRPKNGAFRSRAFVGNNWRGLFTRWPLGGLREHATQPGHSLRAEVSDRPSLSVDHGGSRHAKASALVARRKRALLQPAHLGIGVRTHHHDGTVDVRQTCRHTETPARRSAWFENSVRRHARRPAGRHHHGRTEGARPRFGHANTGGPELA